MSLMSLQQLIEALTGRNVSLRIVDGQLSINAPKGALTETLVSALKLHKSALIDFLSVKKTKINEVLQVVPDQKNLYQAFPFSDLQVAFYMASDPYMEYHVQPHYYNEINCNDLDIIRYEQAINLAFQRHKGDMVLITDDEQLRVVSPLPPIHCQIHDFSECSTKKREQGLMAIRQRMMRQELPLNQWPWIIFEISVWKEQGRQYGRIHSNANNFYSDGFGINVLANEIAAFYKNPALVLPPLELTYRDAVLGLKALSESPEGEEAKHYWLSRLPELPDPPALPQIPHVNRKCRSKLQRRENILPARIWSAIKEKASSYGLTPSSVIITAYAEILSLWSGSRHFILSNMVTRRLPIHPQITEILGNFASLYPLEIDLRGGINFINKARRIQHQILVDSGKRQWGGMQVMQAFNQLKGEFGSVPCPFVVGSALFMANYKKSDFSCLETAQTLLDHQFWELESGDYFYVWDLLEEFFPAGMIDNMWETFDQLLRCLGESGQIWQEKVLSFASVAFPHNINCDMTVPHGFLHQGLTSALVSMPDKIFAKTVSGDYSFREIDCISDRLARLLNVRANELVAIIMDRSEQLLAAAIGVLKAGGAYVPIDPSLPSERIQYLLSNTKTQTVLTETAYHQKLVDISSEKLLDNVRFVNVDQLENFPVIEKLLTDSKKSIETQYTDLAYVIYTSGSTGDPKGVMIDHRGALNTVRDINRRFAVNHLDTVLGVSSFSFDLSVYDIFGALDAGATLVYPDPTLAYNPAHWLTLLDEKGVTVWNSAPPLMTLLLETALRQKAKFPALRLVLLSGDWIPLELHSQLQQVAPNAHLISLGGATEASIWSIYYPVNKVEPHWSSIPYGKPLANQGWQIRDEHGRQVPLWTVGELWITGIGLAKGYWQDIEKTQGSFIIDSETGERRYRTGDMGRYLPDGTIEFLGRVDAQVKIQGYRIELGEIEATLMRHKSVKQAVVLAESTDEKNGNKHKQLVAFIVPDDKALMVLDHDQKELFRQQTSNVLSSYLKEFLPNYMLPSVWALIPEVPLTANGKVDRKALLLMDHGDYKFQHHKNINRPVLSPRTPTEKSLAAIWSIVLNLENLSINDDFFELGGRSFDAVRCVALIKEQLDRELSLGDMWEFRTISRLAEHIANDTDSHHRLVLLNEGGTERQYFMIHPGGGQVVGYYPLAEKLNGASFGLFALEADVNIGAMDSIEVIAKRYTSLIRNQQKQGPYTLIGWSSGSYIAFEIAFQLEQIGETVNEVIIIDAPAPMQHLPVQPIDMLKGFFEDLGLGLDVSNIDAFDISDISVEDEKKLFVNICDYFNSRQSIILDAGQLYPMFCVFRACVNASRNYNPLNLTFPSCSGSESKPKKISAPITVLRAQYGVVTEFSAHPYHDKLHWGWEYLTHGNTCAVSVCGTHHTLLQEPQVNTLADFLNGRRDVTSVYSSIEESIMVS